MYKLGIYIYIYLECIILNFNFVFRNNGCLKLWFYNWKCCCCYFFFSCDCFGNFVMEKKLKVCRYIKNLLKLSILIFVFLYGKLKGNLV